MISPGALCCDLRGEVAQGCLAWPAGLVPHQGHQVAPFEGCGAFSRAAGWIDQKERTLLSCPSLSFERALFAFEGRDLLGAEMVFEPVFAGGFL